MPPKHEATSRKMKAYRESHGVGTEEMARRCGIGTTLLRGIEEDNWITSPIIAARVCAEYNLDVDDYNSLVNAEFKATKLPKPKPKPDMDGYSDPLPERRRTRLDILR